MNKTKTKKLRAWTGDNGLVQQLVIALSPHAARKVARVSRSEFENYWCARGPEGTARVDTTVRAPAGLDRRSRVDAKT